MVTKPSEEVAQIASEARIGIVLRTKDRPTMLTRALEDILAQRFDSWVAVVVNDGGDADAVDEVVERFHDRARGRISTIHHPNGLGRSAAANAGVHGVTTDYVVLHDDDDLWDPGFLEATAACSTKSGTYLRPKLPPRNVVWTITLSAGTPKFLANVQRTMSWPWIGPQTSISPSRA